MKETTMNDSAEVCRVLIIHNEAVQLARQSLPPEERIQEMADLLKNLCDPTRIKMINALAYSELCVCDLGAILNMNQPAVSQQLKTLKQAGLIANRKDGKIVYYRLNDKRILQIYEMILFHLAKTYELPTATKEIKK
jgi:DNA-binding transcriptional ArsR family regulator